MSKVTSGWKHIAIGWEGTRVSLDGLDPWQLKWHAVKEPAITVCHPSHPHERHSMWVYELRSGGKAVKFAAGEYSSGVWGFYVPAK